MQRSQIRLVFVLVVLGCGDDAPPTDMAVPLDAPVVCPVATWSASSATFERWPEPQLLVPDTESATGVRLEVDDVRWAEAIAGLGTFAPALTDELAGYDGFGVNAEAYFRFDASIEGHVTGGLAELREGRAVAIPTRVSVDGDGDDTLFLAPELPLPDGASVIAWAAATSGSCATAPGLDSLGEADRAAVDALEEAGLLDRASLLGVSAYRTGTVRSQSNAVARRIAEAGPPELVAPPECEVTETHRLCRATIELLDFRDSTGRLHPFDPIPTDPGTHEVPIAFWLPLESAGRMPAAVFGHGLGSRYEQGGILADRGAPAGIITVGLPALAHAGHPTQPVADAPILDLVFDFFTLDPTTPGTLDLGRLRENFRQTIWERLQVFRFLADEPDLDGDGEPDVDATRLAYVGGSLGAIMGPQTLAGVEGLRVGVLAMPGGRLASILTESRLFGTLFTSLRAESMTVGDLRRFLPLAQTVLDPADPSSFAAAALREHPEPRPSVLVALAQNDEIVPNASTHDLVRALDVPLVAALEPIEGVASLDAPLAANVDDGTTAGLLQFDRVIVDGESVNAQHRTMPINEPAIGNFFRFVQEGMDGVPSVRDPYPER